MTSVSTASAGRAVTFAAQGDDPRAGIPGLVHHRGDPLPVPARLSLPVQSFDEA